MFSENKFDMGRTHLVEHTIDTGGHRPIHQGLWRHPRAHLDIIDSQVSDLLKNDFTEPAASPWASNVEEGWVASAVCGLPGRELSDL